ncbi:MAG: hypothetical protein CL524_14655 [Aequorivita sp.]|nr:hypothetical protein [Aequorivita sp.]
MLVIPHQQQVMKNKKQWTKTKHTYLYRLNADKYYARIKVNGKLTFKSLKTDRLEVAKAKLRELIDRVETGSKVANRNDRKLTLGDIVRDMQEAVELSTDLKPKSKDFKNAVLGYIERFWHQDIHKQNLDKISLTHVRQFFLKMNDFSDNRFNQTRDLFNQIWNKTTKLGLANFEFEEAKVNRKKVKAKVVELPTDEQFEKWIEILGEGKWGRARQEYVKFLAYSGLRGDSEAWHVTWADVDFEKKRLQINGDPQTGTKNDRGKQDERHTGLGRYIPLFPQLEKLLKEMQKGRETESKKEKVLKINSPKKAMRSASERLGIKHLTRHDLRHWFTTKCIESGVDVGVLAKWRGDADKGEMILKIYNQVREEHSQLMAAQVAF